MSKYITSRLLIVFLINFFFSWAINIQSQLIQFFDFNDGFIFTYLCFLLMFLILAVGLFIINVFFSILRLTKTMSFKKLLKKIKNKGFLNSLINYLGTFSVELQKNIEFEQKKYQILFILFIWSFIPFLSGNPILNNYYGIYKDYEIEYEEKKSDKKDYIFHKSKINEINRRIRSLNENTNEGEPDFEVETNGYLFLQAGIIDGYKTNNKEYKGFLSYIKCLFYSAIEKLFTTIIYFLIPYISCIAIYNCILAIYHFIFRKEKTTNS